MIGNSDYAHAPRLENPVNDAADIAAALKAAGFEVETLIDLEYDETRHALTSFGDRAEKAEVAVIYFAGHGIEIDRQNYLLPVDAAMKDARDVSFQAMPLDLLQRAAEPAGRMSLVIVDACRNNPFAKQLETGTRSISRGLSMVVPRGKNRLVAFAAKEGTIAEDGEGRNSPYAAALKQTLVEPGLEIGKLFRKVRDDVMLRTKGRQEPAYYGSLTSEDFYFVASAGSGGPAPKPADDPEAMAEIAFWLSIADSEDPRDFAEYLDKYPEGQYASVAARRLTLLLRTPVKPDPKEAVPAPVAGNPAPVEGGAVEPVAMGQPKEGTAGGAFLPRPAPAAQAAAPPAAAPSALLPRIAPGVQAPPGPDQIPAAVDGPAVGELDSSHPEFPCVVVALAGPNGAAPAQGCVRPVPVSYDDLRRFIDEAGRRDRGIRAAADSVERGFGGVAEGVSHWLATRYAAWLGERLDLPLCIARVDAMEAGARHAADRFEPATFRELSGDVCRRYENYVANLVVEIGTDGSETRRCINEFTPLKGQVFRLMRSADACR
nr:caspase family protein [Limibaculum sp. NKW23]